MGNLRLKTIMPKTKKIKLLLNKSGLTLVETMIALVVLIIGVVYLISFFPFGLNSAKTSAQQTVAVNLAQAKIEEIISLPYAEAVVGETAEASLDLIDGDFTGYSRTISIKYVDGNLNQIQEDLGLKKVKVTVFWQDTLRHSTSSVALATLITEY